MSEDDGMARALGVTGRNVEALLYVAGAAIGIAVLIGSFFPRFGAYVLGPGLLLTAAGAFVGLNEWFFAGSPGIILVWLAFIVMCGLGVGFIVAGRNSHMSSLVSGTYFRALRKCFNFRGRAPIEEFWIFALVTNFVAVPLVVLFARSLGLMLAAIPAMLVPLLAVSVRRLHDSGRSGWWLLVLLLPGIGALVLLVLLCLPGQPGRNRYGLDEALMAWEAARGSIVEERRHRIEARSVEADARFFKDRPDSDIQNHISQISALPEEDTDRWGVLRLSDSDIHARFTDAALTYSRNLWAHVHRLRTQEGSPA